MQENNLFEYAVIRYVPRPHREEFLNIGVIIFCHALDYLDMKYSINSKRLRAFYPEADISQLQQFLHGFEEVCCGKSGSSPIAHMDKASRFRWLTSTRSTILQVSKVHPGFCNEPAKTLDKIFSQLVEA